jgi:electron transfer flavoprotein-quinone oxidoreductase
MGRLQKEKLNNKKGIETVVERVDTIIVGAGPAGSATAYSLAQSNHEVLLVERAKTPGEKNVSGGVLFSSVLHDLIPNFWEEAPIERTITNRNLIFLSDESSFSFDFSSKKLAKPPHNGYSIIRYEFDQWFAKRAEEAGALLATGIRVDDLLWENKRIVGIKAGDDEIRSNVVVAADGINSKLPEQAGLRKKLEPKNIGLGIKEVIQLPSDVIENRFNLEGNEGTAHTYLGCTKGYPGGGFLYTNHDSLSLGIVVKLATFGNGTHTKAPEFIDHLKQFPYIQRLIKDGELIEYSAHLVPEGGYRGLSKLYTDGFLVTGDAAGLALNIGYALEGMNYAIASGIAAAKTIKRAKQLNSYSAKTMKYYQRLMKHSFVLKNMKTFQNAPIIVSNPRLMKTYPNLINNFALQLYQSRAAPRSKLINLLMKKIIQEVSLPHLLLDGLQAVRSL